MFEESLIETESLRISKPILITGQTAHEPDLALAPDGTLWVVWSERERTGDRIRLRAYRGNEAGHIIDVSTAKGVECQPTIALLPDGAPLITWVANRDGGWYLLARVFGDGRLSSEQMLLRNAEGIFHPRLLADGRALWLIVEVVRGQRPGLMLLQGDGLNWQPAVPLITPAGACYRPQLAPGPDAGIWTAYDCYAQGQYRVYIQRVDRPGEPLIVTDNGYQNVQAALTADSRRHLWIAWASNQNEAQRDRWWLTKWVYLRRFDGGDFGDPVSEPPGKDIYNDDSFQGWEFPALTIDAGERIWIFGQSSHTLYAQYYHNTAWSPLFPIAKRHWGSWKPRAHVTGSETLYLATMGLDGAQLQRIDLAPIDPATSRPFVVAPREPNPVTIRPEPRPERPAIATPEGEMLYLFFGDLHCHSAYGDAVNDVDEIYYRYRDAYGYDFACLTEHDYLDGIELSLSELKMMWNHADRMTEAGRFVAFCGYEWTSPAISEHASEGKAVGEGHKHIIFPDNTGPLISYGEESANTGAKLLARLQGLDVLVIPHHTGWSGTNWDGHDPALQRLVEVCSTHGRFEYAGNRPIGHRRDHTHPGRWILDGLARGYRLGFVGGSDSHGIKWHGTELEGRDSHVSAGTRVGWKQDPFRTGMTAILAPVLTREALYGALARRRCYATSGVPIVLDFRVNEALMGSDLVVQAPPALRAMVQGTAPLRAVEIIRSGQVFMSLHCQAGEGLRTLNFTLEDSMIIPGESHYYYLRVTQEDGNMAWSSPIWAQYERRKHG